MADHVSVAETNDFLDKLLPADATQVDNIIAGLRVAKESQEFIPLTIALENELYEPFTTRANNILAAHTGGSHSYWTARPNDIPKDGDETLAPLRPDAACVLGDIQPLLRLQQAIEAEGLDTVDDKQRGKLSTLLDAAVKFASSHIETQRSDDQCTGDKLKALTEKIKSTRILLDRVKGYIPEIAGILAALAKTEPNRDWTDSTFSTTAADMWAMAKRIWLLGPLDQINKADLAKLKKNTKVENMSDVWWLRVVVPVEMKAKKRDEDRISGSAQLCRYMRMVLKTQLNRNFVFGLLLCHDELRLFFCDRSGLIATRSWIHVNTATRDFAQIVLALSRFDPNGLGWNKDILLCSQLYLKQKPPVLRFFPPTDPMVKVEDYGERARANIWARPIPNSDNLETVKNYLTVATLSWVKAEAMTGSATLVWVAKELDSTREDVKDDYVVLKQTWKPIDNTTEKDLHGPARLDNVGFVISSVTRDEHRTVSYRRGLLTQPWGWDNGVVRRLFKPAPGKPVEAQERDSHLQTVDDTVSHKPGKGSVPRVLTETLIEDYGWSVSHSKDLTELITVIRDALNGHRNLYFNRQVLHRDISEANILIRPKNANPLEISGCLIDLDHATRSNTRIKFDASAVEKTPDESAFKQMLAKRLGCDLDEFNTIVIRCQGNLSEAQWFAQGLKAIRAAVEQGDGIPGSNVEKLNLEAIKYPTEDQYLRWIEEPETCPPSWKAVPVDRAERTGTTAFMSYEILRGVPYNLNMDEDVPYLNLRRTDLYNTGPVHTAIQDIESFFWVLVYQCLHRRGPGPRRRSELASDKPSPGTSMTLEEMAALRDHSKDIFEDEDGKMKRELFINPHLLEDVLSYFHPYFARLKPLVHEWWRILVCTYNTYNNVAQAIVHDHVLGLLNKHLELIEAGEGDMKPTDAETSEDAKMLQEEEVERRKVDLRMLKESPWKTRQQIVSDMEKEGDPSSETADPLKAVTDGLGNLDLRDKNTASTSQPTAETRGKKTSEGKEGGKGKGGKAEREGEDSKGKGKGKGKASGAK